MKKLPNAYYALDKASVLAIDAGLRSQVASVAKSIDELASKDLAAADADYAAQKYPQALRVYRILARYAQIKTGAAARAKLKAAEKDPTCAQMLLNAKAAEVYDQVHFILKCAADTPVNSNPVAATQPSLDLNDGIDPGDTDETDLPAHYRRAQKLSGGERVRLLSVLDAVIKAFPTTPSGKVSTKLRDRLLADPTFAATITTTKADDDLRQTFDLAEKYRKAGNTTLAAEHYRKVLVAAPKSSDFYFKAEYQLEQIELNQKEKP